MKQPTGKKLSDLCDDLIAIIGPASVLIEDYVEGKPVSFNRLENYFSACKDTMRTMDCDGMLISALVLELEFDEAPRARGK